MKYVRIVLGITCFCGLVWADFFPLIGYNCRWPYEADSCNFNTLMFAYNGSSTDEKFDAACQLNMKIILTTATFDSLSFDDNIIRFSSGQKSAYETEGDSFDHNIGGLVNDPSAHLISYQRTPGSPGVIAGSG
jgi:hypothetical protein